MKRSKTNRCPRNFLEQTSGTKDSNTVLKISPVGRLGLEELHLINFSHYSILNGQILIYTGFPAIAIFRCIKPNGNGLSR